MMDVITQQIFPTFIEGLVTLLVPFLFRLVLKGIQSFHIKNATIAHALENDIAIRAVMTVEQLYKDATNSQKFEKGYNIVADGLTRAGISFTDEGVKNLVEFGVKEFKTQVSAQVEQFKKDNDEPVTNSTARQTI